MRGDFHHNPELRDRFFDTLKTKLEAGKKDDSSQARSSATKLFLVGGIISAIAVVAGWLGLRTQPTATTPAAPASAEVDSTPRQEAITTVVPAVGVSPVKEFLRSKLTELRQQADKNDQAISTGSEANKDSLQKEQALLSELINTVSIIESSGNYVKLSVDKEFIGRKIAGFVEESKTYPNLEAADYKRMKTHFDNELTEFLSRYQTVNKQTGIGI